MIILKLKKIRVTAPISDLPGYKQYFDYHLKIYGRKTGKRLDKQSAKKVSVHESPRKPT